MSSNNRLFLIKHLPVVILVLGVLAVGVAVFSGAKYRSERRILCKALSMYFAEYQRYPRDKATLVKGGFLKEGEVPHTSYMPGLGCGDYKVRGPGPFGLGFHYADPPPLSETSRDEIVKGLRWVLKDYYSHHRQYPKDLREIPRETARGFWEEIRRKEYPYSVSEDLQSFTLDGHCFGPPYTWRSETSLLNSEGKVQLLEIEVASFFSKYQRYPKNLQEMIDPSNKDTGRISERLYRDLTEGENIAYRVSEDGKTAYLNAEPVRELLSPLNK